MSKIIDKSIVMTRGDTLREEWRIENDAGAVDVSAWTIKMDVARTKDAPALMSFATGSGISFGEPGAVFLDIPPAATEDLAFSGDTLGLVYDVEFRTPDNIVMTLIGGDFTINKDVTL